jgi:anthranilate synthase component 2
MILLIDNYDSFTYNLYQYMGIFEKDIKVVRNDKITIEEIEQLNPNRIVLSPGPKSPKEAGICMDVVKHFYTKNQSLASAWDIRASELHLEQKSFMQKN